MTSRQLFRAARVADAIDRRLAGRHAVIVEWSTAGSSRSVPRGELPSDIATTHEVHDLGDVSLLPGFVETHIHMHFPSPPDYREIARPEPVERMIIRATANMRRLLLCGATTARDTGSRDDVALAMRDALRDGVAPGPRLLVAGAPITTTAGHYWFLGGEADSTEAVVRRVRRAQEGSASTPMKLMASGGGYTPTSNPRSQQYGVETLRAAVVRGAPARAAGPGALADRRQQPGLRGGGRRHRHPRRRLVDRLRCPRPRLRLRPGRRRPDGRARHLGRPDHRRGRAPRGAPRGRRTAAAGVPALGAARRAERARAAPRHSCATWPPEACGSSAAWAWACRSSRSTPSPAAPRSMRGCWASTPGRRSGPSPPMRPPRSGSPP